MTNAPWTTLAAFIVLLGAAAAVGADPAADGPRRIPGSSAVQGAPPPVPPQPLTLRVDDVRSLGSPTATLALVEFGDYQCPYCRDFDIQTLPQIVRAYVEKDKVRYFYRDFPLSKHPEAFRASVVAHCAGEQGRYWETHRRLYANQQRLGEALYTELMQTPGVDRARFKECRDGQAARRAVQQDIAEARAIGVRLTPTFALGRIENGRVVVERIAEGVFPLAVFEREIEALRAAPRATK